MKKEFAVEEIFHPEGFNCAESVLVLLISNGVIDAPRETIRLMTGFGGGMKTGKTCGAVVGGVAAIGWKLGRTEPSQSREIIEIAVKDFLKQFGDRFAVYDCDALQDLYGQGVELKSESMYKQCTTYVRAAAEIVTSILEKY